MPPNRAIIRNLVAGAAICLLPGGCAPAWNAPPVSIPMTSLSGVPVSRLERGYQIHQSQCGKCHPFEDPVRYDPVKLKHEIMPEMAKKSNLGEADADAVLQYLLAARRMPPQNAPSP